MLKLNKKKADSLVVSYVLLISITLAIAGIAYAWLRFQSDISEIESCSEGVSIFIKNFSINSPLTELNLTLLNNGRFIVKGFFVRINNQTNFEAGTYNLKKFDIELKPNEEIIIQFNNTLHDVNISSYNKICFLEVQPFVTTKKKELILCKQMSTKKVPC